MRRMRLTKILMLFLLVVIMSHGTAWGNEDKENGVTDQKRIDRIMDLLVKFPPARSAEKGFEASKTDPVRRSVDIVKDVKMPPDEPALKQ